MAETVAVLFARADSVYKKLPSVEVYDMERDARTYDGPWPVVAHPPCRAWGRLRTFCEPRPDERNLARLAVALVREFGGVLEHPANSSLWKAQSLPQPGQQDEYGGWTLAAPQMWWGHRAEKLTWFYIVGCELHNMPPIPMHRSKATHVIAQSRTLPDGTRLVKGMPGWRPEVSKAERERTPPDLAIWLVDLARLCTKRKE